MAPTLCFPVRHFVALFLLCGCFQKSQAVPDGQEAEEDVESARAVIRAMAENDPCRSLTVAFYRARDAAAAGVTRAPAEARCLAALKAFWRLPKEEQVGCLNASEPAVCRVNIYPNRLTPKCSFVCDVPRAVPAVTTSSSQAFPPAPPRDRGIRKRKTKAALPEIIYEQVEKDIRVIALDLRVAPSSPPSPSGSVAGKRRQINPEP